MKSVVAGAIVGAALFVTVLGTAIVRPTNLGWTMRHDLQTYVLAWTHFRHTDWQWPLGLVPGVGHPVGTSIGNADAIPLAAFALKPLAAWLPEPFQYLGAWLLLCFALQGAFAVLVLRMVTPDWRLHTLGAALFVQVPALVHRLGHPALCAHFLLIASIGLVVDDMRTPRRWHLAAWVAVAAVVAAVQPYIAGMVLLLACAAFANRARREGAPAPATRRFAIDAAAVAIAMGLVFWQCGYFTIGGADNLQAEGLGRLSMNLLSPVMGMGFSVLLPEIPEAVSGQYEGLVYFGAGWLVLTAVAFGLVVTRRAAVPRLGFGWLALAIAAAIAVSPVVTWGPNVVVDLSAWAPASLAVFRSSGRFGWVPMYATFILVTMVLVSHFSRRAVMALLAAAVVLQAVDLNAAYRGLHARSTESWWTDYTSPLASATWQAAVPAYRHLVTVPPDMCEATWAPAAGPHLPFSLLAGGYGVTVNSGNAGRYDARAVERYCLALDASVRAGTVDDGSLYVLSPLMRDVFVSAARVPLACGRLDGFDVCATATSLARWQEAANRAGFAPAIAPVASSPLTASEQVR